MESESDVTLYDDDNGDDILDFKGNELSLITEEAETSDGEEIES